MISRLIGIGRLAVALGLTVGLGVAAEAQERATTLAVPGRFNANPSIAARGNFVVVAWSGTRQSTQDVFVATSRDGGASWSAPSLVNAKEGDARVGGEQPPRVALLPGKAGTPEIVVVWGTKGEKGARLVSARSTDGGSHFGASVPVPGADGEGNRGWESIATDAAGRVHVLWLDHRETVMPAAMHHQDGAAMPAASPPTKVDPNEKANKSQLFYATLDGAAARGITRSVCYCCKTSLAASGNSVYAVWRHVFAGNQRDIGFALSRDGGRSFGPVVRVSEDHWQFDGCPENGPAVAVDGARRVHVFWVTPLDGKDGSPLALYLAMSADGATFSARTRVPTRGPAAHVQVVAEPAGSLVAAWEENVGGTRRVAFARVTVDTAGKVSVSPLRVGVDEAGRGYPVVASTGNGVVAAWVKQEESGTTIGVARAR